MDAKTYDRQLSYLNLADEFLLQYLACGSKGLREKLILSRLFSMGHSLELYAKAVLLNSGPSAPPTHTFSTLQCRTATTQGCSRLRGDGRHPLITASIDSTTCISHQGRLLRSTLTDRHRNSMMSPARTAGASGGARVGGTR